MYKRYQNSILRLCVLLGCLSKKQIKSTNLLHGSQFGERKQLLLRVLNIRVLSKITILDTCQDQILTMFTSKP